MTLDDVARRIDETHETLLRDMRALYMRYAGELDSLGKELEATPNIEARVALAVIGESIARMQERATAMVDEIMASVS